MTLSLPLYRASSSSAAHSAPQKLIRAQPPSCYLLNSSILKIADGRLHKPPLTPEKSLSITNHHSLRCHKCHSNESSNASISLLEVLLHLSRQAKSFGSSSSTQQAYSTLQDSRCWFRFTAFVSSKPSYRTSTTSLLPIATSPRIFPEYGTLCLMARVHDPCSSCDNSWVSMIHRICCLNRVSSMGFSGVRFKSSSGYAESETVLRHILCTIHHCRQRSTPPR